LQVLYGGLLYFDKIYTENRRAYMKIQDIAAQVGGFIKMIMIFFQLIFSFLNKESLYQSLIFQFFEISEQQKKTNLNESSNIVIKINNANKLINNQIGESNHNMNAGKKNEEIEEILKASKQGLKKVNSSITFSFQSICKCCIRSSNKQDFLYYQKAKTILKDRLDIMHYMLNSMQIEDMKSLLLNEFQKYSIERKEKEILENKEPNKSTTILVKDKKISTDEKDIHLLNYLIQRKSVGFNDADQRMLGLLEPNLREYILYFS